MLGKGNTQGTWWVQVESARREHAFLSGAFKASANLWEGRTSKFSSIINEWGGAWQFLARYRWSGPSLSNLYMSPKLKFLLLGCLTMKAEKVQDVSSPVRLLLG
jgi:hypothetical protein